MRKELKIAAAGAVLVMLVAAPAVASWGSAARDRNAIAADESNTLTVIATHVHFTTADVGLSGPSPGDELVFTAQDVNLAGDIVGRLDGYCVFTKISDG